MTAVLLYAAPTHAQVNTDEAKERYRRGTAAYNLGHYHEAALEYERAYAETLDPALLFNVAQSYRLAGEQKKAAIAYRSYLRSAPDGDRRDLAAAKLRELEAAMNYDDPFAALPAPPPRSVPASAPPPPAPPPRAPTISSVPAAPARAPEAAAVAPTPAIISVRASPAADPPPNEAFYRRWPFWAGVGLVVGVVVVLVAVTANPSATGPKTDLGTMRF